MDTKYPHQSQADLPGLTFSAMRQMILAQAKVSGLKVLEDAELHLTVETAHGLIGLRPGANAETAGMVAAADERWLFVMKNAVIQQMRHVLPAVAEAMRWSDGGAEGSLPPNFVFVRVTDVAVLGSVFLRVTLEGEDLSSHGDSAIHFRLVQPPKGTDAEWPSVAANGSIVWPDGAGAPHRPVYTARSVDHAANKLVTDVFIHAGGRTTDWAKEAHEGKRDRTVVGLVGPSGGGLLDADHVLMATDETGFPAAARLLENLPPAAKGRIFLEAEQGESCGYPIGAPEGVEMIWLSRAQGDVLADATLDALPRHKGAKIWFAGERQQATSVREAAKAAGWETGDLRISGFWRAEAAGQ
ncbi:MAG: siderophore-interacting protein [Pseudomonadota bacterium]